MNTIGLDKIGVNVMFKFGNANAAQREAISTTDGPVLITAGPGTGKTFTLVQRAVYLIEKCGVEPEQILIATFTEKAAKELITRITNELAIRNIAININDMYIGTFHSLCLRIIKEHLEYTRLKRNYRLLDTFDQQYLVFRNIYKFRNIENYNLVFSKGGAWRQSNEICNYVNNLSEELVSSDDLIDDSNPEIVVLANILDEYQELLSEGNLLDFAAIQTECYRLLVEVPLILEKLQEQIKYLMIDEYQDTNYIQEQIVFLIGGKHQNICVVGDDDQGLYRFRGATIRNILEFPNKFKKRKCKIIPLVVNYRSNSDIVDFYNKWMSKTEGCKFRFSWGKYRFDKRIEANQETTIDSPAVIKLASDNDEDEWHECILSFIKKLKTSGKITDYNQLAFLFNSVKHQRVMELANYLEQNGINVYSPRSDMFFKRFEIRLIIGCLMLMFPNYVKGLENGEYQFLNQEHYQYYVDCIRIANEFVKKAENRDLLVFIRNRGKAHIRLKGTTDYAYSGLIYQLFMFKPFSDMLDADMSIGVVDIRPTRNLALFTQVIGKYEYLHSVDVLDGSLYRGKRGIDTYTEILFNQYLRLLYDGGITEYEDDSEYAPSGCVSFLTIHQSKGMEFPIVFVDSLSNVPRKSYKELMSEIEDKYFHRPAFEPYDCMKYFDFWRLYYTAFSRAQDLLVLTWNVDRRTPSKYFMDIYKELPSANDPCFDLSEFEFKEVKTVNLKNTFSFTSHISVYETCALQYKFYRELEFMPIRQGAMVFGTLVHETIEDIHKAVLRGEENKVNEENITQWFNSNYVSLVKSEHTYLAEPQKNAALNQVLRYADRQSDKWDTIKQAEVDVTLVQPDYIIEGKIDLVKGKGNTVELVDFKSERKPDIEKMRKRLEHYRRQLQLYAYLIEQRTGQKVSRMHLYYTGEENSNPMITFPYTKSAIEGTVAAFDDTVHKILRKEYSHCSENPKTCMNCDFRFYCQGK
ncbi:MAG: ATP-dependent helicase [Clostridiales bacterium]|nr:ATP-dependent helicase [Clostridiales bacterium]